MNKTERAALDWMKRRGFKGIIYQGKKKAPCFLTSEGSFEVKRAYLTRTGDVKILFPHGEKELLKREKARVLVFEDRSKTPLETILPEELDSKKVRNVILHDTTYGKVLVAVSLNEDLVRELDNYVASRPGFSRSVVIGSALEKEMVLGRRGRDISITR